MPILTDNQTHNIAGSTYGFSGKRIEALGASEYTLVVLAADTSGSVAEFLPDIEKCIQHVVRSCEQSPRADNLLFRLVRFDQKLEEVHGFKPLTECNLDDYQSVLLAGGCTALYDASHNAIASVSQYGKSLSHHDFDVNGIVFIITDGEDNASLQTVKSVKKSIQKVVREEHLESLMTVLIGVNVQTKSLSYALKKFSTEGGLHQYIEIERADHQSLSRLANFVSRSISLQSRALSVGTSSLFTL
jgi:uncharacterized protein YegL